MTVDWHQLFVFNTPPLELIIRGSLVYGFLFVVFRSILQRDIGAVGIADILLVVLVADASQNAMASEYTSVAEGVVLMSTILGWNLLIDWAAFRFPRLRHVLQPPELCLVRDGRINQRNLRRELMSKDELYAKLREHGIADLAEVKFAYMESDGSVSVIRNKAAASAQDDDDDDAGQSTGKLP